MNSTLAFDFLRSQVVGIDSSFETPFGRRLIVYCDYTASGRCLTFIERYVQCLQRNYANTHTEDDLTGRSMSQLLHAAEAMIKRSVNAGPTGASSPAAPVPPAPSTSSSRSSASPCRLPRAGRSASCCGSSSATTSSRSSSASTRPGSPWSSSGPTSTTRNEVTWRQGLATVVEVNLAPDGGVDLEHLESC